MNPTDWAMLILFLTTLGAGTYAGLRLADEHTQRRENRDNARYWANMQRTLIRAERDFRA